jgi:hypothetical protein
VVVVDMGDQHGIEAERIESGSSSDSTQVEHPRTDHGIGQQADAVQLEEDGAVAEPGKALAPLDLRRLVVEDRHLRLA